MVVWRHGCEERGGKREERGERRETAVAALPVKESILVSS
jgi:hypothetical protein